MIAWMTGWKWRWPNITAPSITSSGSSLASDSTISTASEVPATTRSSWLSAISSSVGLRTYSLLEKPTRAAPIGPLNGAPERHERRRGCDQRQDVGIVFEIVRQRRHDHLRLIAPAIGEQRADRAVDQARNQRFLLGRTAFALEVAARNAAGRVILLLVVDGEGQEVDAFARRLGGDHGRQNFRLSVGGEDGAVGLAGYLSGLEDELAPAPIELNTVDIEHFRLSLIGFRKSESHEQDGETLRARCASNETASGDPAMALRSSVRLARTDLSVRLYSAARLRDMPPTQSRAKPAYSARGLIRARNA